MEAIIGLYTMIVIIQIITLILHIKYYKQQEDIKIDFVRLETYKRFLKSNTMKFISNIEDKKYIG